MQASKEAAGTDAFGMSERLDVQYLDLMRKDVPVCQSSCSAFVRGRCCVMLCDVGVNGGVVSDTCDLSGAL